MEWNIQIATRYSAGSRGMYLEIIITIVVLMTRQNEMFTYDAHLAAPNARLNSARFSANAG